MLNKTDLDGLLFLTEKIATANKVIMTDVMDKWGVQESIAQFLKMVSGKHLFSGDFIGIWFKIINQNLESAIWLCVYNRMRLDHTQKESIKMADAALSEFVKER